MPTILFFGTPQFAADILQTLIEKNYPIVAVITRPDKAKGRSGTPLPSPVKEVALAHNLPIYQPAKVSSPEFAETLAKLPADLYIVAAYGEIMKQAVLDMPKIACINVHASLLPKYRGAAPIQWAIINGEKEAGVTIMHMALKMDAGDMIKKAAIPITENMTAGALERALCKLGAKTLLEVLQEGSFPHVPQEESGVTYAPKIELEGCEVKWDRLATDLHNLIRGVTPEPGAWCFVTIQGVRKRLKIVKAELKNELSGVPGELLCEGALVVACKEGALSLLELQPEGKRAMSAGDFLRGNKEISFQIA